MVNKVMVIGRLGQQPEVRYTQNGKAVTSFSVAVNERWKDKSGQQHERVEWIRIQAWDKTAENAAKYLHKGSQAYIEGKLQTREWEDKQGVKRWTTEVQASHVVFLDTKPAQGNGAQQADAPPPEAYEPGMFG